MVYAERAAHHSGDPVPSEFQTPTTVHNHNHHHQYHPTNLIHPLWNHHHLLSNNMISDNDHNADATPIMHRSKLKSMSIGYIDRIAIVIGILSCLILINMAIMDHRMNRLYQQWNNTLPYLRFSTSALVQFGALSPDVVINNHILTSTTQAYGSSRPPTLFDYIYFMNDILILRPYLQCVLSVLMCTSVLEWFIVVMAWIAMVRIAIITTPILTTIPMISQPLYDDTEAMMTTTTIPTKSDHRKCEITTGSTDCDSVLSSSSTTTATATFPTWYQIIGCYVISAWTGQLWFFAFNAPNAIVGCVSWGTCGTLCMIGMIGMIRPQYRFILFLFAVLLVIYSHLLLPYSSVYGTTTSALFGCSLASCGFNNVERKLPGIIFVDTINDYLRRTTPIILIGKAAMVLLVLLPVLSLAF